MTHLQIATAVALIAGYFAAHVAGLLTKAHAPAWVLGAVTTVFATLAGILPTVTWNEHQSWKVYVGNVFAALIATTLAHRSQIPEAIQTRTRGVVGHRQSGEAAAAVLLVIFIVIVALFLGFAVNHLFLFLLLLIVVAFLV